MPQPILAPPAPVLAPIAGDADRAFPVRRLFCIGRNYAEHAREMGKDPSREPPFHFTKWADTVVPSGTSIGYPPQTESWHHEVELVVAIGQEGLRVPAEAAEALIWGYGVGLDMTRRDLQAEAKRLARPWDIAKNVEQSSPLGPLYPKARAGDIGAAAITLTVDGVLRQEGRIAEMIWSVPEIIAHLTRYHRLLPGDLIFTGTPSGVGPVLPGNRLDARIEGLAPLHVTIGAPW